MNRVNRKPTTAGKSFSNRTRGAVHAVILPPVRLGGAHLRPNAAWHINKAGQVAILYDTSSLGWRGGFKALHGNPVIGVIALSPGLGSASGITFSRHGHYHRFSCPARTLGDAKKALLKAIETATFNPIWVSNVDDAYNAQTQIDDLRPTVNPAIHCYLLEWLDHLSYGINELLPLIGKAACRKSQWYEGLAIYVRNGPGVRRLFCTKHQVALDRFDALLSAATGVVAASRGIILLPKGRRNTIKYWNTLRVMGAMNPP